MKKWIKDYFVYLLLAVSLFFNVNLFMSNQKLQTQFDNLQSLVDESAITINVYDGGEQLVKTVVFLPSESGISLYELLIQLNDRTLLSSSIQTSGWITSLHAIDGTGVDNKYWIIFSATNVACAGFSDAGYSYANVCNVGAKDILIGFHDTFDFRLLAWNA